MKKIIFVITLFCLSLAGCSKKETIITGQFTGESKILRYSVPISEMCYLGFEDTIKLDEEGSFSLKVEITKPVFIYIWNAEPHKQVKLLVEPGGNYHVVMNIEEDIQISGTNEKGQMLYATLPDPYFIQMEARDLQNDSSLISIHDKIEELKLSDLSKFKELLDNKETSKSFFDLVQTDRDCYYASLEAMVSLLKIYRLIRSETGLYGTENGNDLLENLKEIYAKYPPYDEKSTFSSFWYEYVELYIKDYNQFNQKDFDVQNFSDLSKKGILNTFYINESKKYLSGKALEFFQARYIHHVCYQKNYEKELIALFEQFEKDFPKSEYSKYLSPFIDEIAQYHQIIEKPLDETVIFMDNYENLNTLEEVIKSLKGKKIYIDVWAMWCAPCKEEFKNNKALKKILVKNDIQQLYISIDDVQREQQWKDGIKFYELAGTHIRANKELSNDLMKRFSDNAEKPYIAIPWYILIDEEGNIMEKHAKSPSKIISEGSIFNND